ncbi:ATP-binding protein [Caulobacter sp. DWR1-3-2b1]|uniref:ATP-binding protein n=1 Tax=Caulobacter sp. DWR1-3-2b1 TaxID=2804670 RepID=UPI003CF077DB
MELVRNARTAIDGNGAITVRARSVGDRIWLTVADTGRGMSPLALQGALNAFKTASAHGTGLGRVQHFARQAGGHVRIRSREGQGAVISIILPMSPFGTVAQSAARQRRGLQGDLH